MGLIAQESKEVSSEALSNFSRLIGGEWHLDNSYQTFEWGVGEKSVRAKSYFLVNDTPKLVSEGAWIWHPGLNKLKGYFTAIAMPYDFFEYTTSFEENTMINELVTYSSDGASATYIETWEFTDDDRFIWTLFTLNGEERMKVMEGNYVRK